MTIAPKSLGARPFDLAAFAAEPSPVAGVTQDERTQAVVALVNEAASLGDGKVILVGHSAGGMTISAVAEQVPELLVAVVYIAGFMVPNGLSLLAMLPHEAMSSALSPGLFVGDPAAIGATRINPGPADEAYRSLLKASFYADVTEADFAQAASQLALRRTERRRSGPIRNHAWQIRLRAAPLHPHHTGSCGSVDRSGSHDRSG